MGPRVLRRGCPRTRPFAGTAALLAVLIAIWLLMLWLKRSSFTPFVIYRIVLGLILLAVAYGFV